MESTIETKLIKIVGKNTNLLSTDLINKAIECEPKILKYSPKIDDEIIINAVNKKSKVVKYINKANETALMKVLKQYDQRVYLLKPRQLSEQVVDFILKIPNITNKNDIFEEILCNIKESKFPTKNCVGLINIPKESVNPAKTPRLFIEILYLNKPVTETNDPKTISKLFVDDVLCLDSTAIVNIIKAYPALARNNYEKVSEVLHSRNVGVY